MKICAAQICPVKGDIPSNINRHKRFIERALSHNADMIIFPELSLTGYEPQLAGTLAATADDHRLNNFQTISNNKNIIISVGLPLKAASGITISMIIFRPQQERQIYSKKYIHSDEEKQFTPGDTPGIMHFDKHKIGLAICYEISVPDHVEKAAADQADIYLAGVAKSKSGAERAWQRLSKIAAQYKMNIVMSNSIGPCDNFESAGMSAAWSNNGRLLGWIDDKNEGLLIFDSEKHQAIDIALEKRTV